MAVGIALCLSMKLGITRRDGRQRVAHRRPRIGKDKEVLIIPACLAGLQGGRSQDLQNERGVKAYNKGDYETALSEILPIAKKGHAAAQYNMGILWEEGRTDKTPQDDFEASNWYALSAQQGRLSAMVRLANIQMKHGYKDNAISWYVLAARHGNQDAVNALIKIDHRVPSLDILIAAEQKEALRRLHLVGSELTMKSIPTGGKHQASVVYHHPAILFGHVHDGTGRATWQHQGPTLQPPEVQEPVSQVESAAHAFSLQSFRVLQGEQPGQLRVQCGRITGQPDFVGHFKAHFQSFLPLAGGRQKGYSQGRYFQLSRRYLPL
jgi:hypothetical protein